MCNKPAAYLQLICRTDVRVGDMRSSSLDLNKHQYITPSATELFSLIYTDID